jgi:hypothetical protein
MQDHVLPIHQRRATRMQVQIHTFIAHRQVADLVRASAAAVAGLPMLALLASNVSDKGTLRMRPS